ncbi:MAG: DUF4296 domain-containing protein [Paludibacteraceae bacterium]|nr:DUF4296 domain-containing protein [Paludibacteraceae bacterium]MBN2787614.1 DUF4296 domain-containing protein [Paludibacteraceae bacterium]
MRSSVYVVLLLAFTLLLSCENKPQQVISDEKMEAVMLDLFLFEGAANAKKIPVGDTLRAHYYNQILEKHGITLAQYDSSLVWYMNKPKAYEKIHQHLQQKLEQLDQQITQGKYNRPIAPNDSIDSVLVHIEKRDIFYIPSAKQLKTDFTVKDTAFRGGDLLKLFYTINLVEYEKNSTVSATITVFYANKTKQKESTQLKLTQKQNPIQLAIQTKPTQKIDSLRINVLDVPNKKVFKKGVTINTIQLYRFYNAYRTK